MRLAEGSHKRTPHSTVSSQPVGKRFDLRKLSSVAVQRGVWTVALFLGPVRRIAKSDSQLRHVRSPARMEQLDSHWTDYHAF